MSLVEPGAHSHRSYARKRTAVEKNETQLNITLIYVVLGRARHKCENKHMRVKQSMRKALY